MSGRSYYGLYHSEDAQSSPAQLNVHLATSTDLVTWTHVRQLLDNADMPFARTLQLGDNDAVLVLHEQWMKAGSQLPSRIGFKLYLSESDLVDGRAKASFNASLSLGCASELEGTPSVWAVVRAGDPSAVDVYVGFHFNDAAQLDQNGFGVLRNFGRDDASVSWTTYDERVYNAQWAEAYHVVGNIGQRTPVLLNDVRYVLQEGNIGSAPPTRWQDWRLWLWRAKEESVQSVETTRTKLEGDAFLLNVQTPRGSFALGNPSVSIMDCPPDSGFGPYSYCLFASYFIFSEGAGPGEAGSVLFYKQIIL